MVKQTDRATRPLLEPKAVVDIRRHHQHPGLGPRVVDRHAGDHPPTPASVLAESTTSWLNLPRSRISRPRGHLAPISRLLLPKLTGKAGSPQFT